jgi:acyl transferase domain-containing protein/3-hydroxymyristoyl/3-hydroxydecanoyl-(acyl carrier protein) dehydratase
MAPRQRVAIVGIGGIFPQSATIEQFWANVKNGVDTAREAPPGRWILDAADAFNPIPGTPDRTYSLRGCFIEDFPFNPAGLALERDLLAQLDPMVHLALHAGRQAWRDAVTAHLDPRRVGVILGNIALPTDSASAWTREILGRTLAEKVAGPLHDDSRRTHPLNRCVAGLPAGLLAKALGLGGGSFALDAACASSLYALKLAADELHAGRADAMLTGGVSRPECLYTQMGFAQLRALSPSGRCAPFDAKADGLVVGEGSAIFVLKRLDDALKAGDRIYAVIAGVGLSNDVHGRLLAPSTEGQLRAMRAAYEQAGWAPHDLDLIECHGTGTVVGDGVEFASLTQLWQGGAWAPGQCVIGSVKSNVGHTLTAAGSAGLLKVLLALQHETLPPTANFASPEPHLAYEESPFRVLETSRPWQRRSGATVRRAAVSAFGFGGINAHVLLEEWDSVSEPGRQRGTSAGSSLAPGLGQTDPAPLVAIVGMDAHFGPWESLGAFQDRVMGSDESRRPAAPTRCWGVDRADWFQREHPDASLKGFYLEDLVVPADRFRIPPRELEEMLPQQLLMLKVAAGAIDDAQFDHDALLRTGVFIGIELDPNTTNFNLRWALLNDARDWNQRLRLDLSPDALAAWTQELRERVHPALTANRTMGALGGIVASRIAREFRIGGPSFTISAEGCSGLQALEVAVRRLQQGELDQAIVGAVDLVGDIRTVLARGEGRGPSGEGAAAVILKRLDDAIRAGDRVYAVIRDADVPSPSASEGVSDPSLALGLGPSSEAVFAAESMNADIGDTGAAAGLAALVKATLCLHHELLPTPHGPQYWLRNRAAGPRRATVSSSNAMGSHVHAILEEAATPRPTSAVGRRTFRKEALFAVEADDQAELRRQLQRLREHACRSPAAGIDTLARTWWQAHPNKPRLTLGIAFVAESCADLVRQLDHLPAIVPQPLGPLPRLAFVFPGSGNHYPGMGRELSAEFPEVLRRQDAQTDYLRDQVLPDIFWNADSLAGLDNRTVILGQVALGTVVSDLLRSLGVEPDAAIGYSLGESAALFALRAWTGRDEMLRRLMASPLFVSDLAGECNAARRAWRLAPAEAVDWSAGIVPCPAEQVRQALAGRERVYLLIVNTPRETVIGGARAAVEQLVRELGTAFIPLSDVSTVHCEIARQVEDAYRALHLLRTTPPAGIRFYSGALGRCHELTRESAADSIVTQALHPIDFPALIEQAYRDGIRVFLEIGPGSSCTRMIGQILGPRPHLAQSACMAGQGEFATILRVLAGLIAARVPVDLRPLYGQMPEPERQRGTSLALGLGPARMVHIAVGGAPFDIPPLEHAPVREATAARPAPASAPILQQLTAAQTAKAEAHEVFLRFSDNLTRTIASQLGTQIDLAAAEPEIVMAPPVPVAACPALDRANCLEFAVGSIASVLGPEFAAVDAHPTRVRLPDEPLMLVDRILSITGTPLSLTSGIVVTEHDIHLGAWYLDAGRIPTCIAVEAGQADLFLSGYLGIDFQTKGLAVYRLLDAVVTFHRGLPGPGAVIHYEIHIDNFFRQGATHLFRFRFEGTVDGAPLLTMRDGCAGFFTAAELDAGKGIVQTELDRQPRPGVRPADWEDLVPMAVEAYDERKIDALRAGNLAGCFGPAFAQLDVRKPLTIPGGAMKLVDRVVHLDPSGGRFGLGLIRAEADIHPDAWFLTCHFIDDQVMPGTLMYECCLHTLRIFLLRMGWVVENNGPAYEPVPGVASRLKCRGQVLAMTRKVTYEVSIKEIGYRPEPYVLVDALMYADGKAIVEITDMSLQLSGTTRDAMQALWSRHHAERDGYGVDRSHHAPRDDEVKPPLFGHDRILAFAVGNPSAAFGEPYRVFDKERFIARLPGPPYQFLDRITAIDAEPWQMVAGGVIEAQYDVPSDAWYFAADRQDTMPFAVLLEVALQPCGWLAAYLGSALTSPVDLSFRNLGGSAIQHRSVPRTIGVLTTTVRITKAAKSGGMIIQDFEFDITNRGQTLYRGTTTFGFFSKASLAQQVGVREAKPYQPSAAELARSRSFDYSGAAPFPARDMEPATTRMLDRIELFVPEGGPQQLGFIVGSKRVDPAEWFFKAHFYLDPVCPGSLGLESFLQLLKVVAAERWGASAASQFDVVADTPHRWIYRGQVIPSNQQVTVQASVTAIDDERRTIRADGFLLVDGLVIYQMNGFTLRMTS